ncbi:hypothetical protein IC757_06825 [Wenzhouxiangella sp. AB-CW3]|uniref:hypothetical protein n=1 Tax=Wenzhouxiangella sp. AB-CW3 TaxID=2771012 RepID=UPI00168A5A10|nr:hypothetical protein [Wenzhouxiangella sp. AB-CW3]QOC23831.1 hypothetical protein IC757_06825 [Wenzhouxiangella sp. AB-CW3]
MTTADILLITTLLALAVIGLGLLITGAALTLRATADSNSDTNGPWRTPDRQWHIERLIYRHHRISGGLIILASLFFLWQFVIGGILFNDLPHDGWQLAAWLLLAGNLINLFIGLVILVRPSRLKHIEATANRWMSLDAAGLSRFLARYPRIRGLMILLTAIIVLTGTLLVMGELLKK